MPVIYARNFATGTQQYVSLNVNDYVRQMSIGTNWKRIRIGILCALGTVSENAWPIRIACLNLGVCTGSGNSPGSLSPAHAVGYGLGGNPPAVTANFTYNAGTAGNSYFSASAWGFYKIASGVYTVSGVGSLTVNLPSNTTTGGALARRGIFILDMNKSALVAGNMTQGITTGAVAHMALDVTSSDLYSALEWYTSAPTIQGTATSSLALGNSLAFNETTNGMLDNVYIHWNHYTVPFQLYELAVFRVG